MKHGSFRAVCLILMAAVAVSFASADENTVNLNSVILESFDGDSEYDWRAVGSKFASKNDSETFPKVSPVTAWPMQVFGQNREGKELKSLGIWSRFDRRGYNWIDVYPVAKGSGVDASPTEIPIPGRVRQLDMWVWGSNLNYSIEIYVRDYQGVVHVLPLGNIAYEGWKDLRVTMPNSVPQGKRILPRYAGLSFVKFRVWTQPTEQVNNSYIYFDQFKVLTDTFESIFDGNELAQPERIQELWSGDSNGSAGN